MADPGFIVGRGGAVGGANENVRGFPGFPGPFLYLPLTCNIVFFFTVDTFPSPFFFSLP